MQRRLLRMSPTCSSLSPGALPTSLPPNSADISAHDLTCGSETEHPKMELVMQLVVCRLANASKMHWTAEVLSVCCPHQALANAACRGKEA